MSKIRINELARELEVKPSAIIDLLPELGVTEKNAGEKDQKCDMSRRGSWPQLKPADSDAFFRD